ncbi:amidohydrolase family protein [Pseudohongiella sp. SYSU M77423]|uniref:amidohydrolase family protein n=1 Tax=Pseudohongiella sp. SYSU M77423 TaxID=3042312 RepID=UPI002480ED38|nr:amidohydrolase family protein [Pseudohongiella sp. SYSU M77423]MDH7942910.1 amidohydrolase family protein [Pseudohongiella sp. SYSU M77423]
MTRINKLLFTIVVTLSVLQPAFSQSQATAQNPRTILLDSVHIIDVTAGTVSDIQQVLLQDGRIVAIGESVADNVDHNAEFLRIDSNNGYLMPGLMDMHAHIRHPLAATLIFPQFVANGVTGIREMNSECDGPQPGAPCLQQMQTWQQQIDAGELVGPRLLALSSFPVNPPWDYEATEEQIRGLVAEMDNRGVDLIKTYFRLSPQAFRWLADEAGRRELMVSGHLPVPMTVTEAVQVGLNSLEHARDLLFDCFPGSSEFRSTQRTQNPSVDWLQRMVTEHNSAQCEQILKTMADNDTWYVPTHVTRRMDAMAGDSAFRNDPRRQYIWPEVLQSWDADADNMLAMAPSSEERAIVAGFYQKGLELTGQAQDAGVRILMGTDSGDSYSYFGASAHDELQELVKAGLTPAQALQAATISAAEFLGMQDDYGDLTIGKVADLILLRANPLEDISNSMTIEAVFMGKQYYDREALDTMLQNVVAEIDGM